ncbi:hypothetical protein BGX21_008324 [Mortierella sp. AD011]|nr:hypothetical protein BGX20_008367 [Mortierella sp. AD010]KAF9397953.1 hypothetical protein BGX21_008324 [Mortierella sp. AD011]
MAVVSPLDLPEIRLRIGDYLSKPDLAQCICVCKVWNESYLPFLWKEISVTSDSVFERLRTLTPERIIHHRELVQVLSIVDMYPGKYKAIYPRLNSLTLGANLPPARERISEGDPTELIKRNPSLTRLTLTHLNVYLLANFWKEVSNLPRLQSLKLSLTSIDDESHIRVFWGACTNLEVLSLMHFNFAANIGVDSRLAFPKLHSLTLDLVKNFDQMKQLYFIRQCPQLKELVWHTECPGQGHTLLAEDIGRNLWPHLDTLSLGCNISDEALDPIIKGMARIRKLDLLRCRLGTLSFQSLRNHFSTLAKLILWECPVVTSIMLREVLCSCPLLEELKGGYILARDAVDGGPWICRSMKTIHICFIFRNDEQDLQPLIFERLSHFVQLRNLGLGGWVSPVTKGFQETLDFRLESGLGQLVTMKNINHLSLYRTTQALSEEDVRWISSNWRQLEVVSGKLNHRMAICDALENILRERGVRVG